MRWRRSPALRNIPYSERFAGDLNVNQSAKEWRVVLNRCFGNGLGPRLHDEMTDQACGVPQDIMSQDMADQGSATGSSGDGFKTCLSRSDVKQPGVVAKLVASQGGKNSRSFSAFQRHLPIWRTTSASFHAAPTTSGRGMKGNQKTLSKVAAADSRRRLPPSDMDEASL